MPTILLASGARADVFRAYGLTVQDLGVARPGCDRSIVTVSLFGALIGSPCCLVTGVFSACQVEGMEAICVECGNDLATEGYRVCWDCLELLGDEAPVRDSVSAIHADKADALAEGHAIEDEGGDAHYDPSRCPSCGRKPVGPAFGTTGAYSRCTFGHVFPIIAQEG